METLTHPPRVYTPCSACLAASGVVSPRDLPDMAAYMRRFDDDDADADVEAQREDTQSRRKKLMSVLVSIMVMVAITGLCVGVTTRSPTA